MESWWIMKSIDILILDITLIGGIERVASILANNFSPKYQVRIISIYKTNENIFYDIDNSVEIIYLSEVKLISSKKLDKLINYFLLFNLLKVYLKSTNSDVVISMFTNINIISAFYSKLYKKLFIATEHAQYKSHSRFIRLLRRIIYPKLERLVVLNTTDYSLYKSFMGNKVHLIPNPLTFEVDDYSRLENKVILSAGRLSNVKGFDLLLEVFNKVAKKYPDWKLIIAGDGIERARLLILINNLNLTENVELRNFEKNIDKVFLESSIYCLTSREECFPMILLEAMSFGLPVISFDVPSGPRDIIFDSVDGFLVEPFNIDEYVNKICKLISDKTLRIEMGKNAKRNIMRYSVFNIMKKWEEIMRYD